MAVTISRPEIGKRPDILDNGEQRINPQTGKLVWIPEICVTMSTDAAADEEVCVTIYQIVRRPKGGTRLVKSCTKKATLPKKIDRPPGGSMTTLVKVCCDLLQHGVAWIPQKGTEFRAAWQLSGGVPCPDEVPMRRDNRSPKLRVGKPLELCMYAGDRIEHSAIVGIGLAALELEKPQIDVAASLPLGWELELPETMPVEFPAAIAFGVVARPGAFLDEVAEVSFRVVDIDGFEADDITHRFAIAPNPSAAECLEAPEEFDGI